MRTRRRRGIGATSGPAEKLRSSVAAESAIVPEKRTEHVGGKLASSTKLMLGTVVELAADCGENATEGHVCATS